MSISLITPTGDRPEQLCTVVECINNQTVKPDKWIIADDGVDPIPECILHNISIPYEHIRLPHENYHTLRRNFLELVNHVDTDTFCVIEDDDYYPINYIEDIIQRLVGFPLVGQAHRKHYNLSGYFRDFVKHRFGELHSLAFHSSLIPQIRGLVRNMLEGKTDVDLVLCDNILQKQIIEYGRSAVIHLVGWPSGRSGITKAHRNTTKFSPDLSYQKIKEWLGPDFERYKKYIRG